MCGSLAWDTADEFDQRRRRGMFIASSAIITGAPQERYVFDAAPPELRNNKLIYDSPMASLAILIANSVCAGGASGN